MRLLHDHELEKFYLLRRIELIDLLQGMAENEFYKDDSAEFMQPDDPKIDTIAKYYAAVANPYELNETLKSIYKPETYGPAPEK